MVIGEINGMLKSVNTKSQKSLANIDSGIERELKIDLNILAKENEALAKDLNELIFKK